MKRFLTVLCVAMLGLALLGGCNRGNDDVLVFPADGSLVRVNIGATPRPHHEILDYITPMLREVGIDLHVVSFTDFHVPNVALWDRQIHANYFQHEPFLNAYINNTGNQLHVVGPVHVEPMGAYSLTLDDIMDIPDGGSVAMPNDPTNNGRALMLLQKAGLIELDPAAGILATANDVTANPRNLRFIELEAALVPHALLNREADVSIVNTNHLIAADPSMCPLNDSLIREAVFGNPYANLLVVRPENADSEVIAALYRVLTSEAVRAFILRTYTGIDPVF
ncbi:MAG: MetQ/NlpA family ABC transporter substrate-binding protein [Defluviitaleaceae bacterium]|nr:MetQ/NlpA family ABC transporter substrate-binding protein [Defluviitaleaceae bacterium]MCL2275743.1 MetQ/NlpA family ABC transporter substrate-binding protein [Defluviitaleaceae bacterium]